MNSDFEHFYSERIADFGATAKGMGWKDDDAQRMRFDQLIKIIGRDQPFSLNDLGCGSGDLVSVLEQQQHPFSYYGYDIMKEMIHLAESNHGKKGNVNFAHIKNPAEMSKHQYTVASGIFNIRFHVDNDQWLKYIVDTLVVMNDKSERGFAFNMLTAYSDPPKMKQELYYGDPCFFFDYCKKHFSKNVALLHDYYQYDFTILVRK